MHVVTKILIVFCAVLSLVLAALTMAYAANAGEVRASLTQERDARAAALNDVEVARAAAAKKDAEWIAKWEGVNAEVGRRQARIDELQKELGTLQANLERAVAERDAISNQIALLSATADTLSQLVKVYRDEVTTLRDEGLASTRREIDLVQRINDLESVREVLEGGVRALREQLAEAHQNLQEAVAGRTEAADGGRAFVAAGPVVSARVVEVFKSPAGDDMVVIDQGANRDVRKDMEMNIVRGQNFIAKLVIVSVDQQRAVGRVDPGARKGDPQLQDLVLSRLQ